MSSSFAVPYLKSVQPTLRSTNEAVASYIKGMQRMFLFEAIRDSRFAAKNSDVTIRYDLNVGKVLKFLIDVKKDYCRSHLCSSKFQTRSNVNISHQQEVIVSPKLTSFWMAPSKEDYATEGGKATNVCWRIVWTRVWTRGSMVLFR